MKKVLALCFALALLLAVTAPLFFTPTAAQVRTARRIRYLASAPATCTADRGEVYFNTTDDKLYRCTATDTWTEVGAAGGGGTTINATDTAVPYRSNSTTFADTPLLRTAANVLEQRNGVNAQSLYFYRTYTSGADYRRLEINGDNTNSRFDIKATSTVTNGETIRILAGGSGGQNGLAFTSTDVSPSPVNSMTLGTSSNRFNNIYSYDFNVVGSGGALTFSAGGSRIQSHQNSWITLFNSAANDFSFLSWGLSAARPGLKANGINFRVRNGDDTTSGGLAARAVVVAKTANYTVDDADAGQVFTNTGAAGAVNFTLPTAVIGQQYIFIITAAQTFTITAGASTTIRIAGTASAAAGNISASAIGNTITLVATSTTTWIAISHEGTWTIT